MADTLAVIHTRVNEPDVDHEWLLKVANSKIGDIGKVVPEKKADPYAGLPTVSITFVNGGVQATVQPAIDMGPAVEVVPVLEATPSMMAGLGVNADILEAAL
jgi:hypothetical protein